MIILCAVALLATAAEAQIKATATETQVIAGALNAKLAGSFVIIDAESKPVIQPAVVLKIETDYKFKRMKVRKDGSRIEPQALSETEFIFTGKGKYVCDITCFDPDKGIDDAEVEFEIDGEVKPEPEPKPEPDQPDGPFNNIAAKVKAVSAGMLKQERDSYSAAIEYVIQKMAAKEFRTLNQSLAYLQQAGLNNLKMNTCLRENASGLSLSFNDSIEWFKQVLKGLR